MAVSTALRELMPECVGRRLGPGGDANLAKDVRGGAGDGFFADAELFGYSAVGPPRRQQAKHLCFSRRQRTTCVVLQLLQTLDAIRVGARAQLLERPKRGSQFQCRGVPVAKRPAGEA